MAINLNTLVSTGLLLVATASQANTTTDELKSRILDHVRDAHSIELSAEDLKSIPHTIVCSDGSEYKQVISGLQDSSTAPNTTTRKDTVIVDLSDGDQVSGYLLVLSDLKELAAKKKKQIEAISFDGYWWADGDYYGFTDKKILCQLK